MKILSLLFYIILFNSCADLGIKNKTKQNESTQDITQKHDSTYYADSIYYANLELDSLVYNLKGGYKLYLYPTDANKEYHFRLVGNDIDTVFLTSPTDWEKYIPYFEGIDFDDYFIVKKNADSYIYEKKTGKKLYNTTISSVDIANNLIICLNEDNEILVLRNLKKLKEVVISDYITTTTPAMKGNLSYYDYSISKVINKYVIIIFAPEGANESSIEIKIPIDKIM